MKPLTRTEIKAITGVSSAPDQVAVLRRHGLNPFVCPTTGRPLITAEAINAALLGEADRGKFIGNMEVFD